MTCDALRYTPAGMPLLNFTLFHESVAGEGDQALKAQFELSVSITGQAAMELSRLGEGTRLVLKGALVPRSRRGQQLVMRAAQYKLADGD